MTIACPKCTRRITGEFHTKEFVAVNGTVKLVEMYPHAPSVTNVAQCVCGHFLSLKDAA